MNIDWKKKLSSRKFWALVSALIIAVVVLCVTDAGTIERITSVVGAFLSVAVYIFCEASIDKESKE